MPDFGYWKAAALSPRVTVANPAENAKLALEALHAAGEAGVQAAVLPELYLSGYSCGDLFRQSALLNACEAALLWLAEQTKESPMLVVLGLPVRGPGGVYNCAAVLQNGEILALVPKEHLSQAEARWFRPYRGEQAVLRLFGREIPFGRALFSLGERCVAGVELGEDLWDLTPPSVMLAAQGANLILCPAADSEGAGRQAYRRNLIAQHSGRLRCGYVLANAGAGESSTDLVYPGVCMAAENGRILTESKRFEQDGSAVYCCIDLELLQAERFSPAFSQTEGALPVIACKPVHGLKESQITRRYEARPFVPNNPQLRGERCREVLDMQTAALAKRLTHTGIKSMILGLSGGLDSTVALLVAARTAALLALPMEQILGITMPGFGTTAHTRGTVDALAESLGITLWEIDIRPACELHMQDIGHDLQEHDITFENTQARERTQILMDLANQEGALLLGTGDLSELALGWCTYGGDQMSMYNVNCGVPKTLLRPLVEHVMQEGGTTTDTAAALRRVISTPISPELLPPDSDGGIAQRTEDTLGHYDVHDFYLYHMFRYGFTPEKLHFMALRAFDGEYTPAQLKAWLIVFLRRYFSQQFKRSCAPDGPRIGSVSLSPRGGLHMPSDAAANIWLAMANRIAV